MKILVTGGAGFIASHIVDTYVDLGHNVVVIDNLSSGKKEYINKKAAFYQVDIRNKRKIDAILEKEEPEIINHHAAQISVRSSVNDPNLDAEVNILGLLNLLETGRKVRIKKFIFASSGGAIYGEAGVIPTSENYTPLQPLSPYGVSKLASEYYLNVYYQTYKIPYIALRYANVYGPRQNPHGEAGVVAIFALKLLKEEIPIINGDGKQTRDYIYVDDVVEANKIALFAKQTGSFNIGTGVESNVIEIYENLKNTIDNRISAKYGPARQGEQKRSCLNCRLANELLGWEARTGLMQGLEKTVAYFKRYEENNK